MPKAERYPDRAVGRDIAFIDFTPSAICPNFLRPCKWRRVNDLPIPFDVIFSNCVQQSAKANQASHSKGHFASL